MKRQTIVVLGGIAGTLIKVCVSKADVLSSISYYQELAGTEANDSNTYIADLSGNTLPFVQSQTLTLPNGSFITSNYDFMQGSTMCSLNINSQASLDQMNVNVSETHGDGSNQDLEISPNTDLMYNITFVGLGSTGTTSSVDLQMDDLTGGTLFDDYDQSSISESGNLLAGNTYNLLERWDLYLPYGGTQSAAGNSSISITLTAIPEPSSVMMLFGSAVLLLKRPMRWVKAGHAG